MQDTAATADSRFLITQCSVPYNDKVGLAEFLIRDASNLSSTTSNNIRSKEDCILVVTLSLHSLRSFSQLN